MRTYEAERYPGETLAHRVRRELQDARAGLKTTHGYISDDLPFMFDLKQYQHAPAREHRGDVIEPVDAALYDQWRYKKGMALQTAPINTHCEAVDRDADPKRVEFFKHRVDYQLTANRFCNYADVRERWIGGALAARAWAYRWDFVPYLGAYGEIVPRLVDPRMLFIPSGYLTPHDPLCPRLHEVFRIPINEARRMPGWKHTGQLKPDKGEELLEWLQSADGSNTGDRVYFDESMGEREDGLGGEGMATFCMTWYRFEFDAVKPQREIPLEPEQQYLQCLNEDCNEKSPRQYELADMTGNSNYRIPAREECVRCGAVMTRVTKEIRPDEQLRYEEGKRLAIVCLNGSVDDALYDDAWPVPDCPTFPYAWLTCEKEPHRLLPESDTSLGRNLTIGRNFTLAAIYQQAHASRAILLFPRRGIEDANGLALDHMDELADVLFYTGDLPDRAVDVVQGAPVNPALTDLYMLLKGTWKENQGESRISLGANESKDIPVGTLKQLIDSGNVPINTFVLAIYAAESISFTNLACYIRKYETEERSIRYRGKTGKLEYAASRGIDLPDVDVTCSAGPSLSNIKAEEIQAVTSLAALPGPMRRLIGRAQGVDESLLDEMDEAQAAMPVVPGQPGAAPGSGAPVGLPAPTTEPAALGAAA